jgi:hypothetical protein
MAHWKSMSWLQARKISKTGDVVAPKTRAFEKLLGEYKSMSARIREAKYEGKNKMA